MSRHALALVESPTQLLNVIELGRADPDLAAARVLVLAPAGSEIGHRQLRLVSILAEEAGHEVCWQEPRTGGGSLPRSLRGLAAEVGGVDHLVIGDPFSGLMQAITSLCRPRAVTVVDDGTATFEFVRQWTAGERLSRWHDRVRRPHDPPAGHRSRLPAAVVRDQLTDLARRRISAGPRRRLRLFTSLPVELARAEVLRNDFGWVRRQPPPEVAPGADLVGTSLVESGVVGLTAYLEVLAGLRDRYGATRYLAHRRERADKLLAVDRLGLAVVRPNLPLELVARQGPVAGTLVSFPSTVVHTLPVVLADTSVEVVVCDVAERWLNGSSAAGAGSFLDRVSASARHRHGLATV